MSDQKHRYYAPWKQVQAPRWEVPWQKRTYCFNYKTGVIAVVYEEWHHTRDKETGDSTGCVPIRGTRQNQDRFPELTFDKACQLFEDAERTDEPLRIVFARLYGKDLHEVDLRQLAKAPDVYPALPAHIVVQTAEENEEQYQAFLSKVNAPEPPPHPVKRRPGRPAKEPADISGS